MGARNQNLSSLLEYRVSMKQVSNVVMASVKNFQEVNCTSHAIKIVSVLIAQKITLSDT